MVISKRQFCVNLLSEFFKPSGNLTPKSQLALDANRPLLNASINQGFRLEDTGLVQVELEGINFQPGKNLFTQDCFDFNCFTEEGLENSYANIGTDVCLVQGNSNEYMTPSQRAATNSSCFIDNFNKKRYFIRGTRDIFNYVYVADIGIINTTSGYFTVLDANVPFYSTNKAGSLFALSLRKMPYGVKAVRIKRVSTFSIETIGTVYGQLEQEFYFPHSILKPNRTFTFEGQKIALEDLSINLLLMSSFKSFEAKSDQIIYRNINYSSPKLENIVFNSGRVLRDLVNNDIVPQRGSIPKFITSYLSNEDEYNSEADELYSDLVRNCFEVECFQLGCFEEIINSSLVERSVDNRAMAWLVQFLISYAINYNTDLNLDIAKIVDYIIRQKDPVNKLYYKGWDQIEEQCVELSTEGSEDLQTEFGDDICLEGRDPEDNSLFYNSSLTLNQEILTSTNVAIFLALLKAYEYTQDFNYIVEADELYTSINKYLVNSSNLYKHSLTIPNTSIESGTYQLILNLVTEEYGSINELTSFFKSRLFASPVRGSEVVQVGIDDVLVGADAVLIPELELENSDKDNILFTLTEYDSISSSEDIFKYNYLAFSSFKFLNNKFSIPFIQQIEDQYKSIEKSVVIDRKNTSLIFAIGCLINNDSFLSFNNIKFNSLLDFNNYRFQKEYLFNSMLLNTPREYNWFSPSALTRGTHIGAMLYSFSKSLSRINAEYEKIKRSLSIDELYGVLLNKKAEDYNLVRFNKENDNIFRIRIKNEIFSRPNNKSNIESKLSLFNTEVSIKDNYSAIVASESSEDTLYNSNWGVGYLQGPDTYNTNIVTFNFAQPVEPDVYQEIQNLKPAGIKIELVEVFTFSIGSFIEGGTAVTVRDINGGCDNLDLETGSDILLETGNRICLEDDETILTPVTIVPPVLPPLDDPIITEDPNSCDCLNLRGYVTINATVTEVRNLRTINNNSAYDVNITNDTVEPCNLQIDQYLQNNVLEYLEIIENAFSANVTALGAIKSIQAVVDSSETNQLFTIATIENGGQSQRYIWREGNLGFTAAPLSISEFIKVSSTTNFIFILDSPNNTVLSIDKSNMNITVIPFTPDVNTSFHNIVKVNNTTIGIYSVENTDNILHTYTWTDGATNLIVGSTISFNDNYTVQYFNSSSGLKRYTELRNISAEIYDVPNFDELGTLETSLSTDIQVSYVVNHEGKNYAVNLSGESPPDITATVFQNVDNILRVHSSETCLNVLNYGGLTDFYNVTAGQIVPIGNYYLIPGSNKAYSFSIDTTASINSLRCPADPVSIPSGSVVQTVSSSSKGVIITTVDLLSSTWNRYIINPVNKTC